jgi:peptidoglycan biosynthesis protein MviN/MurJ (putative lipid II flippase)
MQFSGIILNIGLNLILLKKLELMGASISALVSSIFLTILFMVVSNRYFRIKIEIGTVLYYIGVSCLMFFIVTQINTGVIWMNLILKIITGTVLIALAVLFKENEIRENIGKVIHGGLGKAR